MASALGMDLHSALPLIGHIALIALAFGMTVFIHEFGHFMIARATGMAVHEFSIGFGRPLLFWFKRGETQYSFRLWPFISYVRIAGMEPGDEHPNGLDKKPRWAQALVMVWGCINNFLLGVVIFVIIGVFVGWPTGITSRIERVMGGTPAARAGLRPGDRIVGVDDLPNATREQISKAIQTHPGRQVTLIIDRAGRRLSIPMTPRQVFEKQPKVIKENRNGKLVDVMTIETVKIGQVGVIWHQQLKRDTFGRSVVKGFQYTGDYIVGIASYLKGLVQRTQPASALMGPVGAVDQLYSDLKVGWFGFLLNAAALTIGIGFLNLLPLPPLDGSRLLIVGLEAIRRKAFDKRRELVVHLVGMALLLALAVALTYKDIVRIATRGG